ncbi:MAG: hypothetical protein V3U76_07315 [Granulosicoccus sp.]
MKEICIARYCLVFMMALGLGACSEAGVPVSPNRDISQEELVGGTKSTAPTPEASGDSDILFNEAVFADHAWDLDYVGRGLGSVGNGAASNPSISSEGRYVVFESASANLVAGDTNRSIDIFVADLLDNSITRVSVNSNGVEGDANSTHPRISGDGKHIVFSSAASNLIENDLNDTLDIFLHQITTGKTILISSSSEGEQASVGSNYPAVSSNGEYVVFESQADNLVPDDENTAYDVFLKNVNTGTIRRLSLGGEGNEIASVDTVNQDSGRPVISANGLSVLFHSFSPYLVSDDNNTVADIFLFDMRSGVISRISEADGQGGNGESLQPSISPNGRYVSFQSAASNLAVGLTNGELQIYRHDLLENETKLVSVNGRGFTGDSASVAASVSDLGAVAFMSLAGNLTLDDSAGQFRVYLSAADNRSIRRLDIPLFDGVDGSSFSPSISADGNAVAFSSESGKLIAGGVSASSDIFIAVTNATDNEHETR